MSDEDDDKSEEIAEARALLRASGYFFDRDEEEGIKDLMLNLNDAFYWACADGEEVEDGELLEVARLFKQYGNCGLLYWAMEKRKLERVEFVDINRFVEFVRNEERICRECPDWNKRGYYKAKYTIGALDGEE